MQGHSVRLVPRARTAYGVVPLRIDESRGAGPPPRGRPRERVSRRSASAQVSLHGRRQTGDNLPSVTFFSEGSVMRASVVSAAFILAARAASTAEKSG